MSTMQTAADPVARHRRHVGGIMFAIGVVLLVGWPIAVAVSWEHIVASHARLGYLIGDMGMVMPLCFLSWHGLVRGRAWGVPLVLITMGAQAFDVLHFGIYLIQERFLGIPTIVYLALMALILGVLAYLCRWEIGRYQAGLR